MIESYQVIILAVPITYKYFWPFWRKIAVSKEPKK